MTHLKIYSKHPIVRCFIIVFLLTVGWCHTANAQKQKPAKKTETKKEGSKPEKKATPLPDKDNTVTVTSEFVPTLRDASKINFSGNTPLPSGQIPKLEYDIPTQNLFFPYVPGSLRPLSLDKTAATPWRNDGYIKLGYGNLSTPYAEGAVALGDGVNSAYALHVKHTQSKGKLELQKFAKTDADFNAVYSLDEVNELTGKLYFDQNTVYSYGVRPADYTIWNRDSAQLRYATYGLKVGLRNKQTLDNGFNYSPTLSMNIFSDNWKAHESNLVLNAPVSKDLTENILLNVGIVADITSYKSNTTSINNNIVLLQPAVQYHTDKYLVKAGLTPSWNQGQFKALPDLGFEAKIKEEKFIVLAGYKSYFDKNTFRSLVFHNYWVDQPYDLRNTRSNEFYLGFKGSAGSHFTYNATMSTMKVYDKALFVNDSLLGNRFYTVYEPNMNNFRLHGEFGYKKGEDFSLLTGVTFNQYSHLDSNAKAWGLLPVEMNASLRWKLIQNLWLTSDLHLWNGAYYQDANKQAQKSKGVGDWNIGAEYKITGNWSAWLQVNNLLNSQYQRWNQYQSLGINVLGGVVYNFNLKK